MTGHFSEVTGRNFTQLEVNVIEVAFQGQFFKNFEKLPRFFTKAADRWAASERGLFGT